MSKQELNPIKSKDLFSLLERLDIKDNPNWIGLLLFIRNLIYYFSSIPDEQKAELQKKLLLFFKEKKFSQGDFYTALLILEKGILENCRDKLSYFKIKLEEEKKVNSQILCEMEDIIKSLLSGINNHTKRLKNFETKTIEQIESNNNAQQLISFIKQQIKNLIEQNQQDSKEWKQRAKLLEEKARYDYLLQNIFNRSVFDNYMKHKAKLIVEEGRKLSLLMLDIDKFKVINDKWGHLVGDDVLKALAKIIKSHAEISGGIPCRYGGEELVIIFEDLSEEETYLRAEALRIDVEKYIFIPRTEEGKLEDPLHFTVSIGVAEMSKNDSPSDLIGKADKALYAAKTAGRNQVKRYSEVACDYNPS